MAIKIVSELDKIQSVAQTLNTIGMQLNKDANISAVLSAAHKVLSDEFVKNMTKVAFTNPKSFGHMYEWNKIGDPNSRLWKHVLRGRGRSKTGSFEFKASKTAVPVDPALAAVGVKKRHIFYWKAPVLEYGMPVKISPKIAKVLVYLSKGTKKSPGGSFNGWVRNGIVYRRSPVYIDHAGASSMWGSFTREFQRWHSSPQALSSISQHISQRTSKTIGAVALDEFKKINSRKSKEANIDVMAFDVTLAKRLQASLDKNYAAAAANRVVDNE